MTSEPTREEKDTGSACGQVKPVSSTLPSLVSFRKAVDSMEAVANAVPHGVLRRDARAVHDIMLGLLAIADQIERSNQLSEELLT